MFLWQHSCFGFVWYRTAVQLLRRVCLFKLECTMTKSTRIWGEFWCSFFSCPQRPKAAHSCRQPKAVGGGCLWSPSATGTVILPKVCVQHAAEAHSLILLLLASDCKTVRLFCGAPPAVSCFPVATINSVLYAVKKLFLGRAVFRTVCHYGLRLVTYIPKWTSMKFWFHQRVGSSDWPGISNCLSCE